MLGLLLHKNHRKMAVTLLGYCLTYHAPGIQLTGCEHCSGRCSQPVLLRK